MEITRNSWHYRFGNFYHHYASKQWWTVESSNYTLCEYVHRFIILPFFYIILSMIELSIFFMGLYAFFWMKLFIAGLVLAIVCLVAMATLLGFIFLLMKIRNTLGRFFNYVYSNKKNPAPILVEYVKTFHTKICPLISIKEATNE